MTRKLFVLMICASFLFQGAVPLRPFDSRSIRSVRVSQNDSCAQSHRSAALLPGGRLFLRAKRAGLVSPVTHDFQRLIWRDNDVSVAERACLGRCWFVLRGERIAARVKPSP